MTTLSFFQRTAVLAAVALTMGSADAAPAAKTKEGGAAPATAVHVMTDQNIADAVSRELEFSLAVPAQMIDVRVVDGVVTLSGSVPSLVGMQSAVHEAETVRGVRSVVNEMKVAPSGRSDEEIHKDVVGALVTDPATDAYQVEARVKDGVVALSGKVDSFREKRLVEKVAGEVRGVRGIQDDIQVLYKTKRSDAEIENEVEGILRWDRYVDDGMIGVEVKKGAVNLVGTVGSAAEKRRAELDAWTAGVKSVDADGLQVKGWARNPDLRKDKYARRSDAEIRGAIETGLSYDPRVSSQDVDVSVDQGEVTLRGEVSNLKSRQSAAQVARDTVGVWKVNDLIKVRPKAGRSDEQLVSGVRQALLRDPYVDRYEVDVSADGGIVYLNGNVDSYFEKGQAEDDASRVKGVLGVQNDLRVANLRPFAYNPYVYDWYPYDYDWYVYGGVPLTRRSDQVIQKDIVTEMVWSPFVDADEVNVKVHDGVATLTGTVDTWSERIAAGENAIDGGAVKVINDLEVANGKNASR